MGTKCSVSLSPKDNALSRGGGKDGKGQLLVPDLNKHKFEEEYKSGHPHGTKVTEVKNNVTQQIFVSYKLPKHKFPCKNGQEISKRIKMLQQLEHPNVCRLIEAFDGDGFLYIIYQHVGWKTITDEIVESKKMSEQKASDIGRQLIRALNCANSHSLVHGALVPKNILVQPGGGIVVTDLGLVDLVKPDDITKLNKDAFSFLSPELLRPWYKINIKDSIAKQGLQMMPLPAGEHTLKTSACDIWSAGAILFFLMTGKPPFKGKFAIDIAQGVVSDDPGVSKALKKVSKQAKDLVNSMLNKDASARPTAEDLLQHPWLVEKNKAQISDAPLDKEVFTNFATVKDETHFKKFLMKMVATNLPPKKVKGLEASFNKADIDGDGFMSLTELKMFIKNSPEMSEMGLMEEDAENMFNEVDMNKCGKISLHEFIAATLDSQQDLVEIALRDAWKAIDHNEDGKITKKEMRKVIKEVGGHLGKAYIKDLQKLIDSEINNELTFDEFCSLVTEEGTRQQRQSGDLCSRLMSPCTQISSAASQDADEGE